MYFNRQANYTLPSTSEAYNCMITWKFKIITIIILERDNDKYQNFVLWIAWNWS